MPYPFNDVKLRIAERQSMGFGKSRLVEWLQGLAENVATMDDVKNMEYNAKFVNLGKPVKGASDDILKDVDVINGIYSFDDEFGSQPDVPRGLSITVITVGTPATGDDAVPMGEVLIYGNDYSDSPILESISPVADDTVLSKLAFKSISMVRLQNFEEEITLIDEGDDEGEIKVEAVYTVSIGTTDSLGLPFAVNEDGAFMAFFDNEIVAYELDISELTDTETIEVLPSTVGGTKVKITNKTFDGVKPLAVLNAN